MTRIIFPILCAAALVLGGASQTLAQTSPQASAQTRPTAPPALAADAPERYTVVRGDTLWDISGRFLREPWRWPEVWRLNRDQIANPHLIFPGQVVFLDRSGPWLSIGRPVGTRTAHRLSPRVHEEPLAAAIPSIPLHAIEPFLNRTLVIDEAGLDAAGTVIATDQQRMVLASGDIVFARDVPSNAEIVHLFRPSRPLTDPLTGDTLAHEADFLGAARIEAPAQAPPPQDSGWHFPHPADIPPADDPFYGDQQRERDMGTPATLRILEAVEEIRSGDRVLPSARPDTLAYVPRPPAHDVEGRLVSLHRGMMETGAGHVVTLGLGARDGLEPGHVLALYRPRGTTAVRNGGITERYELPEQRYGLVFVFRIFDRVAHALVMDTDGHVTVGDIVRRP